jgi:hypothetical protein
VLTSSAVVLDFQHFAYHNPPVTNSQGKPIFIPGLKLAEDFFHDGVEPILRTHFPNLRYTAALIGSGSEVLEFDTEMSTDHHWGPRVMIFLSSDDFGAKKDSIKAILGEKLPPTYRGYSTNFSAPNPRDHGTQMMRPSVQRPINHRVEIHTLRSYFSNYMNIDINEVLQPFDWLTLPQQKLRSIVSGKVFHDDLDLEKIRARFAWYPHDIWLYIMASGWARIGQEEHLMGRAGLVGDEIGSALIGARLVRDIIRLACLMEKDYPPYAKWYGTAFSKLKSAARLMPILTDALHSSSWRDREPHLCSAYHILAEMHNDLKITEPLSTETIQFFTRPFGIIGGERFTRAIIENINDPEIKSLTERLPIGSVDTLSDNTDLLEDPSVRLMLRSLYG